MNELYQCSEMNQKQTVMHTFNMALLLKQFTPSINVVLLTKINLTLLPTSSCYTFLNNNVYIFFNQIDPLDIKTEICVM